MKLSHKLISVILSVSMLLSMLVIPAGAAGASNVSIEVDKTEISVGDTVTVKIKNSAMSVISFAGGVSFDKEKFEIVSISGANASNPNVFALNSTDDFIPWVKATAAPTIELCSASGNVSMAVAGTAEASYKECTFITVVFKAIAAGTATFNAYEDSDGTDGFNTDHAGVQSSATVTIAAAHTHTYTEEIVSDATLKTPATTTSPAVYYKSCACGEISTTETFTYGNVLPAEDAFVLSVSDAEVTVGQTVTTTINIDQNPGVAAFGVYVDYDAEAMALESITTNGLFATEMPNEDPAYILAYSTTDNTKTGAYATLTFKVLVDCVPGEYAVTLRQENADDFAVNVNSDELPTVLDGGTITVVPKDPLVAHVESATIRSGKTVDVDIVIDENSGVAAFNFNVVYDTTVMTLETVTSSEMFANVVVNKDNNPPTVLVYQTDDSYATGTLATLSFLVNDDVEGDYTVSLAETGDAATDVAGVVVPTKYTSGTITVYNYILGDVNGDDKVSLPDLVKLARYFAKMETLTETNLEAADVNEDGKTTLPDLVKLARYFAKMDTLGGTNTASYASFAEGEDVEDVTEKFILSVQDSVPVTNGVEQTVTTTISIDQNPGVAAFGVYVDYDAEAMALESITTNGLFATEMPNEDPAYILAYSTTDNTETGAYATLTFKVPADCVPGEYAVTLRQENADDFAVNVNSDELPTVLNAGTITVLCGHAGLENVGEVEATCGTDGNIEYYSCPVCGKLFTDANATTETTLEAVTVSATGEHTYEWVIDDVNDKHYQKCSVCEAVTGSADHSYDAWMSDKAGMHSHKCGCGKVVTEACDSVPEDQLCNKAFECSKCGYLVKDKGEHTLTYTPVEGADEHTATCHCGYSATLACVAEADDDGDCTTPVLCKYCKQVLIAATTKHAFTGKWTRVENTKTHTTICENKDCTETSTEDCVAADDDGNCTTAVNCQRCGSVVIPAGAHDVTEWKQNEGEPKHSGDCDICRTVVTENCTGGTATCKDQAVCEKCVTSYGELDHTNHVDEDTEKDDWYSDKSNHWNECSCDSADKKINIDKHDFEWVVIKEATPEEDGEEQQICEVCKYEGKVRDLPFHKHDYTLYGSNDNYHWNVCTNEDGKCTQSIKDGSKEAHTASDWIIDREATTLREGSKHKECVVCERVLETAVIPELESMYDNWQWTVQQLLNRKFTIKATAGEGGSISDEGKSTVKYDRSKTYTITPDEGYEIEAVYVNGEDIGAVESYTFKHVKDDQTIEVVFVATDDADVAIDVIDEAIVEEAEAWVNPFIDIFDTDDYYAAIEFVYENGLFKGISDDQFAPELTMTRAMFVTVLGRLAGVDPEAYTETSFTDVVPGEWYAPYVEWAAENGIVLGYGDGTFGINDEITVEQAVVILARYAAYIEAYELADAVILADYEDVTDLSMWAVEAMAWALTNEVYEGIDGELCAKAPASRALIAEMLYNYVAE